MSTIERQVWDLLKSINFPGMSRDIVSFGFVRSVEASGERVSVDLRVPTQDESAGVQIETRVKEVLAELAPEVTVRVEVVAPQRPEQARQRAIARDPKLVGGVEHIIAVASGKGGVGKSTIAANLAVRLGQMGHRVGILDCDIYGPSLPLVFGIKDRPRVVDNVMMPFQKYGVSIMSLGFVLDVDTPVIWRGPMVVKAVEQMLGDVAWGELDFLVIDLPPGTGDAQLTLTQKVPLSGAIIVSTPQDMSLIDARKGLAMFRKVNVPVLGLVENMSTFVCPHCGESTDIFKRDGARRVADTLGCRFLGQIPLDPAIVRGSDDGVPIVISESDGRHADTFRAIAEGMLAELPAPRPPLSIV